MKPFDLEKAIAGAPLITRDGRKVEEFKYFEKAYPDACIVVVINSDLFSYRKNGIYNPDSNCCSSLDLFMAPAKKELWINVHKDFRIGYCASTERFGSEVEARNAGVDTHDFVKPVLLHAWEE